MCVCDYFKQNCGALVGPVDCCGCRSIRCTAPCNPILLLPLESQTRAPSRLPMLVRALGSHRKS